MLALIRTCNVRWMRRAPWLQCHLAWAKRVHAAAQRRKAVKPPSDDLSQLLLDPRLASLGLPSKRFGSRVSHAVTSFLTTCCEDSLCPRNLPTDDPEHFTGEVTTFRFRKPALPAGTAAFTPHVAAAVQARGPTLGAMSDKSLSDLVASLARSFAGKGGLF